MSSNRSHLYNVLVLILVALAMKSFFVLNYMPSQWVWSDEVYYYTTAYDLVHLGQAGVPHPGFLNYPPMTSILISRGV